MRKFKYRKSISIPKILSFPKIYHPSSIFQDIYNKTIRKDNINKKININKTEEFLNIIEDIRLKEEIVETDKDYLIKESRKEVKLNQEMLYLFGRKRGSHRKTKNLGKIKLDKKIFLNPLEKKEKNILFSKSKSNVNILKLPMINKIKKLDIEQSAIKNISNFGPSKYKLFLSEGNTPKVSFNDSGSNTNDDDSKKINNNNTSYYTSKNKKSLKKNINSFLTPTTSRSLQKKNKQISSKTINIILRRNNKYSSDINKLNNFVNKTNKKSVINLLDNINKELKYDEKKHKKYFLNNDYGCELSKFKINYLEKHFFQ